MLTGIEIAGLVLATFPIIISAIEGYEKGFRPIKEWIRFRGEYAAFLSDMNRQKIFFRQNIEDLLSPIVDSDFEMSQLLDKPGGKAWQDTGLERELQLRLPGKYEYECYTTTVGYILERLEKLKAKLKIEEGQLHWSESASSTGRLKMDYHFKRITYTLGKKRREKLMAELEKHNKEIERLLGNSDKLEPMRRKRKSPVAKYFHQIRNHAHGLHTALSRAWQCTDSTAHSTKLLLQKRVKTDGAGVTEILNPMSIKFNLFFCHESQSWETVPRGEWCAAEISMVEYSSSLEHQNPPSGRRLANKEPDAFSSLQISPKEPRTIPDSIGRKVSFLADETKTMAATMQSTASEIIDLCIALKKRTKAVQSALGYMKDDQERLHRVELITNAPLSFCKMHRVVSLEDLLTPGSGVSNKTNFSRYTRLSIAAILAHSLLQFHTSPWLGETWGKKDIYFLQSADGVVHTKHPFLICHFNSRALVSDTSVDSCRTGLGRSSSQACNPSLLSLGILILELWFNQTIESQPFRRDFQGPDGKENQYTVFITALEWQKLAMEEGGVDLHNLTRRCIMCNFGSDSQNLEDEELRRAVYAEVVQPLELLLSRFDHELVL